MHGVHPCEVARVECIVTLLHEREQVRRPARPLGGVSSERSGFVGVALVVFWVVVAMRAPLFALVTRQLTAGTAACCRLCA
jgi:hypothetical protein